jgi:alpha-mannosidase
MIATRGLCEYEILRDGRNTMAITLLRAIGEIGDWGVFPTPKGQKKDCYALEYSFIPYETTNCADAYANGYCFALPSAVAVGTDKHSGKLDAFAELLSFNNEYIRMSAFKKTEDRNSLTVRFFNINAESEALSVKLSSLFREAYLCALSEKRLGSLETDNGSLHLEITPKKIITIELCF